MRLLLFTLVGLTVARLSLEQRRLRHELAQQNARLAHYAATLEELAVSRERNRLARELHDTLAHTLSAVSIQLKAIDVQLDTDPPAARATVQQAQGTTSNGLNEVRRALFALRAHPIETHGFVGALRHAAQQVAAHANVPVQLDLPALERDLRPEVEQQRFRISEEALHNSVRHARASCVTLTLRETATDLQIIVADDGVGFDPATPAEQGHYGLAGMRERARLIDAELHIESQRGHGTTVQLRMPVKEPRV